MTQDAFCTTREAAALLGVSVATVQQMVETGQLSAWKTAGGHRRIYRESVALLLSSRVGKTVRQLDVLVAEDDEDLRKLYALMLGSWELPMTVEISANGLAALMRIARRPPDLLITDLMMPAVDGFELIRQVRADPHCSKVAIVAVSSMSAEQIKARGLPAGVHVLQKPIPFDALRTLVLQMLDLP